VKISRDAPEILPLLLEVGENSVASLRLEDPVAHRGPQWIISRRLHCASSFSSRVSPKFSHPLLSLLVARSDPAIQPALNPFWDRRSAIFNYFRINSLCKALQTLKLRFPMFVDFCDVGFLERAGGFARRLE
jgi:hypothetical protein